MSNATINRPNQELTWLKDKKPANKNAIKITEK